MRALLCGCFQVDGDRQLGHVPARDAPTDGPPRRCVPLSETTSLLIVPVLNAYPASYVRMADVRVIAWGLSLERPTMIKYRISNIRELFGHKGSMERTKAAPICRF